MKFWAMLSDRKEQSLCIIASAALTLAVTVELGLPLPKGLHGTYFEPVLTSLAVRNISAGISMGLVAAYIFYLLIDFAPRVARDAKSIQVLNLLLAAVLDSYDRCRTHGHEVPITAVCQHVLEDGWLRQVGADLQEDKARYLQLKFAMETAHSRLDDFKSALLLAINISPDHALQWLVVTDKIRLLADSFADLPYVPAEKTHLVDVSSDANPVGVYKSDLRFRLQEIVEETQKWINLTCRAQ